MVQISLQYLCGTNLKNMKALNAGDYCKPKDEKEWGAILDIAKSLDMYGFKERCRLFLTHGWIWANNFTDDRRLAVNECTSIAMSEISTKDFIAGLYQLAEERKKPKYPAGDVRSGVFTRCIAESDLEKRVKELEASRLRHAEAIARSHDGICNTKQRLEKLEKVVSEEMGKNKGGNMWHPKYCSRFKRSEKFVVGAPDYESVVFEFDPKASPTNIPFSVALEYAKFGRRIRRPEFAPGWYWYIDSGRLMDSDRRLLAESDYHDQIVSGIEANNWSVI